MSMRQEGNFPTAEQIRRIVMDEATKGMRKAAITVEAEWRNRLVPNVRGYRTGTYARSITHDVNVQPTHVVGTVGTNLFYAPYLEYGTGLYGPRHQWIYPKKSRYLRFPEPGNAAFTLAGRQRSGRAGARARWIYARRVRGIQARHYSRDALLIAAPKVERIFRQAGENAARRLGSAR